jgi:hypothetical protein
VLGLVALDQFAEQRQVLTGQRLADALHETCDAAIVDHLDAGQVHLLDRLTRGALDGAQHALLARSDKQHRLAAASGTAGAADAVHQEAQLGLVQRTLFQVIDHATRRAHDHVHATAQAVQLRAIALTTIDRQHAKIGHMRGVALERLGHLDGQLACRCQYQRLRFARARIHARQDG